MATVDLIDEQEPGPETHPQHEHSSHVAHHFDTAQQQFDACKLGMWLFLVTEVLFFSGLFVAYAVYRANNPEVFVDAHKYLNTTLGAFNTIVLLVSSLTMAWAVRAAQLEQKKLLIWLLGITLACASLFLGVKAVEYSHKWGKGLLWAGAYAPEVSSMIASENEAHADSAEGVHHDEIARHTNQALLVLSIPAIGVLSVSLIICIGTHYRSMMAATKFWSWIVIAAVAFFGGVAIGQVVEHFSEHAEHIEHGSVAETSHEGDAMAIVTPETVAEESVADAHAEQITGVFFSIYYVMTGVHAVHILCGMGVIAWLLWRSVKEDFTRYNFGPVDFVGLYWHLVDLVWIYLFPLLYLIR